MPETTTILFYLFAFLTVGFAFIVVFSENVIYSAVSLFGSLFGVAGLYVLLRADFLALTQVMIYIGGILILLIFGIMLTSRITNAEIRTTNLGSIPAGLISAGVLIINTKWSIKPEILKEETIRQIGTLMLTDFLLPFEIASIVLLIALVGAAMYARKND
ncbi:MAG TPA: NADH-quinone oxidoreductase subunit J [Ignavibacteria bacterium]|nr:NADH-quinone oxidoreductase subunit J [Ignavibacteria bacterium]